ncbi:SprT family zinc-dependent metalloprotease [Gimesia maris]|nr:SprT family zinc-dependent metalloprotease [Gimesia maris]
MALNPEWLISNERDAISTLVHEMAHIWQQHFGKQSRKGYHNKEWADEMERIGLSPRHDGTLMGKRTGQRMPHCIIEDGLFAQAFADWPEAGQSRS